MVISAKYLVTSCFGQPRLIFDGIPSFERKLFVKRLNKIFPASIPIRTMVKSVFFVPEPDSEKVTSVLFAVFTLRAGVEYLEIVEVLQVTRLQVDVEGKFFSRKVDSIESDMLLVLERRDAPWAIGSLVEPEEWPSRVLRDDPSVQVIEQGNPIRILC